MNKKKLYMGIGLVALLGLSACDSYLDVMPDKRTFIDTNGKVADLLISAYPNVDPMMIYEHRTDNAMDNGKEYGSATLMLDENYHWKDNSGTDWDGPESLWSNCYMAIATANQALEAIEELGRNSETLPYRGEALLCRAYAHFMLANTFCAPYNPATAAKEMGIPYVEKTESKVGTVYERGTLKEVYEKLERDIEEGVSLVNENVYTVPLYHFNNRAASALAARFYLYKGDFQKVLAHADKVLGDNPFSMLRDVSSYNKLTSDQEWIYRFCSHEEPANLLIIPLRSMWGRRYNEHRLGNSELLCEKSTYRSAGPWGNMLKAFNSLFGRSGMPVRSQPRYGEIFEVTNVTARTGQPHVVQQAFTTDETLFCRAEALVMLKQYDKAAEQLSLWYQRKGGESATADDIANYYKERREREAAAVATGEMDPMFVMAKPFNAVYEIEEGKQELMLQGVLHARRIETMYSGLRWLDIRRYGIEVIHNRDEREPIKLPAGDPRRTIQLPARVIGAGLPANPR